MDKLVRAFDLRDPLVEAISRGLPVYGSCAGMIMLADRIADGTSDQQTLGGLNITVRRNAFGRQVDSYEEDLHIRQLGPEPVRAVFIRAPWVEDWGARSRCSPGHSRRPGAPGGRAAGHPARHVLPPRGDRGPSLPPVLRRRPDPWAALLRIRTLGMAEQTSKPRLPAAHRTVASRAARRDARRGNGKRCDMVKVCRGAAVRRCGLAAALGSRTIHITRHEQEKHVRPLQMGDHQAQRRRRSTPKRGKLFAKLIKNIEVAAKQGGETRPAIRPSSTPSRRPKPVLGPQRQHRPRGQARVRRRGRRLGLAEHHL